MPISTAAIEIGVGTYFSPDLTLKTWIAAERVIIGKFCSIGEHVLIATGGNRRLDLAALFPFDTSVSYRTTAHTTIGNDVWIGSGAVILGGVTVGHGSVISSGAVVFSDVPPFAIAAGNPAQVIRYRFSAAVAARLQRIAWWDWPLEKITANRAWFEKPIEEFVREFDPGGESGDGR
jgi:acetyltransferase-like isoleucine patch superfamily enzyme